MLFHKNGKNYTKKLNIMKIFGSIDKIVELLRMSIGESGCEYEC